MRRTKVKNVKRMRLTVDQDKSNCIYSAGKKEFEVLNHAHLSSECPCLPKVSPDGFLVAEEGRSALWSEVKTRSLGPFRICVPSEGRESLTG